MCMWFPLLLLFLLTLSFFSFLFFFFFFFYFLEWVGWVFCARAFVCGGVVLLGGYLSARPFKTKEKKRAEVGVRRKENNEVREVIIENTATM